MTYGYTPVAGKNGERAIVEAEAQILRRIFQDYVDGRTPRDIAHDLNRENVPPPRGRSWNASTINGNRMRCSGILQNELYVGRLVWNKVPRSNPRSCGDGDSVEGWHAPGRGPC